MNKKILLSTPHMGFDEQRFIKEAFDTNWLASSGVNVDEFENSLGSYISQGKYPVSLCSGTSAIHLALVLLGVQSGDEVLCQSFTFSASANPIVYQGAVPIFIDSEKETWNICPETLEKAILARVANGLKPKAIIAVDLYGMPYQVSKIKEIGNRYNIPIIEDSAEALGSEVDGQKCGTFGDLAVFSFNSNKIITTTAGGTLITGTAKQKERAIFLASQAKDHAPHYQHSEIGYNYRMSNVLAGIGRGQLQMIEERVHARRLNFAFYKKQLSEVPGIEFLDEPPKFYSNRWLTCILTASYEMRERFRIGLEKQNIETRPLWKPMHLQPVFKDYPSYVNGVSGDLFERGLCLPSGSDLSREDLSKVVSEIKNLAGST